MHHLFTIRLIVNQFLQLLILFLSYNILRQLVHMVTLELDEALRLYELNKDTEITIHVFPDLPPAPGMPCLGEDKSIYRRGKRN